MYKIFIVEDDVLMAKTMKKQLEGWGYSVEYAVDFHDVISEFNRIEPHLVLLDITLPFFNGYHWCGEIRKASNVPVVFISSASDNLNIVMAMNMGGDDFIAKPFDLTVLIAKVRAILRRTYNMAAAQTLEGRGAVLNLNDTTISYCGKKIELTKNEFRIMQTLLENKDRLVSRDALMTALWKTDCYVEENTLTVNINRLRKRLENIGLNNFITTKVGSGYIISESASGEQNENQ